MGGYLFYFGMQISVFALFLQLSTQQTTEMVVTNCVSQSDFAAISRRLDELKRSTEADINQLNTYVGVINPLIRRQRETERKVDQLPQMRNENRRLKSEVDNAKLKAEELKQKVDSLMQSSSEMKNKSQELEQKVDDVTQSIAELKIKSLDVEQKVDNLTSTYSEELSTATKSIQMINSSVASLVEKFNESIYNQRQIDNITRNAECLSRTCNSLQNETEEKIRNLETSLQGIVDNFQVMSNRTGQNQTFNEQIDAIRIQITDEVEDIRNEMTNVRNDLINTNRDVTNLDNATDVRIKSLESQLLASTEVARTYIRDQINDVMDNVTNIGAQVALIGRKVSVLANTTDQRFNDVIQIGDSLRQKVNNQCNQTDRKIKSLERLTGQLETNLLVMTGENNQRFTVVTENGNSLRRSVDTRLHQTDVKIQNLERSVGQLKTQLTQKPERYERYLISQNPTNINKVIRVSSVHHHCVTKEKYKLDSTEGSLERGEAGAWCAQDPYPAGFQYVQATFDRQHTVIGVATQGREPYPQYVTAYRVYYSRNCVTFYTDGKTYPGNSDTTSVVMRRFATPITGRCFRINPTSYSGWMSMRFDFIV